MCVYYYIYQTIIFLTIYYQQLLFLLLCFYFLQFVAFLLLLLNPFYSHKLCHKIYIKFFYFLIFNTSNDRIDVHI